MNHLARLGIGIGCLSTFVLLHLPSNQAFSAGFCEDRARLPGGCITAADLATNSVRSRAIRGGSVTAQDLGGDAVDSSKIMDGSVSSADLASGAVVADKISRGAVTSTKLGSGAVDSNAIAPDAVTSSKIATDAVGSAEIDRDAVGSSEIASGAVGSSEIASGAVGSSELASNAVTSSEIASGAVGGSEIASGAVGPSELAGNAVGSAELANNSVESGHIKDSTIRGGDIADRSIEGADLDETITLGSGSTSGYLETVNTSGSRLTRLTTSNFGGAWVEVLSQSGKLAVVASSNGAAGGFLQTYTADSQPAVRLNTAGTGSNGVGYLGVYDANGNAKVWLRGDSGFGSRDALTLVLADPRKPGRHISYSALAGPESALYTRGSVALEQGRAPVSLPKHFAALVDPDSITVSLTPRDASSLGLAAVAVSAGGFTIAELQGGMGSYRVDYLVHADRKESRDRQRYLYDESLRPTAAAIAADKGLGIEDLMVPGGSIPEGPREATNPE